MLTPVDAYGRLRLPQDAHRTRKTLRVSRSSHRPYDGFVDRLTQTSASVQIKPMDLSNLSPMVRLIRL